MPLHDASVVAVTGSGVFHWEANDDQTIQDFNYAATKEAIPRAMKGDSTARTGHP